jgi:hypothetical protein
LQPIKSEKVEEDQPITTASNATLLFVRKGCVGGDIMVYSIISLNPGENGAILLAETFSLKVRTGQI